MRFENRNTEWPEVVMVVRMIIHPDGIEFRSVGFYPRNNLAELWIGSFFNYFISHPRFVEMSLSRNLKSDFIKCGVKILDDPDCEFEMPRPIGHLLWKALYNRKVIQCGGEKKGGYEVRLVEEGKPQKGFLITLTKPPKTEKASDAELALLDAMRRQPVIGRSRVKSRPPLDTPGDGEA